VKGWRETLPLAFAPLMSDAPIIVSADYTCKSPKSIITDHAVGWRIDRFNSSFEKAG